VLTADDLLRRLTQDPLLSTVGPRDLPERQQTMNATVAWSYQLLAPNEQHLFRRLGALPGRFPIEAAAAVFADSARACTGSEDGLAAAAGLLDKSLLLRPRRRCESPIPDARNSPCVRSARAAATSERDDALAGVVGYCIGARRRSPGGVVGRSRRNGSIACETIRSYRGALTWLIERHPAEASTSRGH
jgi:hypothetical protein